LGITFLTTGTLWCFILAYFSAGMTAFLRRDSKASLIMNKTCGAVYLLLGLKLLASER
jgi:threonine/homoserine/homoserine lactone efflux protein